MAAYRYRRAVSEKEAKVVAGTAIAMVTETATEETTTMEGELKDTPETQGLGQYRGQDPPGAAS